MLADVGAVPALVPPAVRYRLRSEQCHRRLEVPGVGHYYRPGLDLEVASRMNFSYRLQTVAIGDPPELYGPEQGEEMLDAIKRLGFSKAAFGVEIEGRDRAAIYRDVTAKRSQEYAAHDDDVILD